MIPRRLRRSSFAESPRCRPCGRAARTPRRTLAPPQLPCRPRSGRRRRTRGTAPSARPRASGWSRAPCRRPSTTSTPLAITSLPPGTVIRMSNAPCRAGGRWPGTTRRHVRLVHRHDLGFVGEPVALALVVSVGRVAVVPTTTWNSRPRRSASRGVIRSSWSPAAARTWRAPAVHPHRADRQQEVEVEPGQVRVARTSSFVLPVSRPEPKR